MDDASLPAPEFLALDAQLHLALAEASGNSVIAAMMAGLRTAIESYVLEGSARIEDWESMASRLRAEHHAIVDAIEAGGTDAARILVRDHITGYYTAAGLVPGEH
jgi:DNA-binding FadR family transcriptional regulator